MAVGLRPEPFAQLVEASLQDQRVACYRDFAQLRDYCRLSADPVGRLVLAVFGVEDPLAERLSDDVCTALQLIEHLHDVGEDRRAGRIYLPADDLATFGVLPGDLDRLTTSPALRSLLAFEADRAEALLRSGDALVRRLDGWARLAVAGYVAGGRGALRALRRPDMDVLVSVPRPRRADLVAEAARVLRPGRPLTPDPYLDLAYAACEEICRTEARNFGYGIRLLRRQQRAALSAVYALARRIDDIGDGDLPEAEQRRQLAAVRRDLRSPPPSSDPVLLAVHDGVRRFALPLDAFDELIDGVERDVRMDASGRPYQTFEELVGYCRCVAGSVGRLSLAVFGSREHPLAEAYADSLGIALQQTNILRDLREDLLNGRVYLPQEDLDRFGASLVLDEWDELADPDGRLAETIRFAAVRAERWYREGLRLVPLLDRRSAACCLAMAGIYRRLLGQIAENPTVVYRERLSLSAGEKAAVAARALVGRPS
jgi:phytoene synthase